MQARAGEVIDCSLAAVLAASSSVEACVNEIMLAHSLGNAPNMQGFDPIVAKRLSEAFHAGGDHLKTLEKADMIGIMAGIGPFDRGSAPGQSVGLLSKLRNELIHHKPEWIERRGPSI
jgi:hypothetical protein